MLWIALTLNVLGIGIIVYKLSLRPHKQSFQPVRLSKSTTVLLIVSFMVGMVTGGLELWSPLVGQENNSAWLAGGLLSLLAIGSLLGSFFYGMRASSTSRSLKRYIMAAIFMGLLGMILAFAKSPGLLLLGVLALGISIGQLGAWGMTLMVQACPGAIREMMAWNVALAVVGIALAQALMGGVADSIGGLILLPIGLLTVWLGLILWLLTHWANLSIEGPSEPYSDQSILKIEHIAPVPSDEAFLNRVPPSGGGEFIRS
jgi:MFS family permease